MKTARNVLLFTLALVGLFIYVSASLTRISGSTPGAPVSAEISAAFGETLFWGKGKCGTCHSIGNQGSAVRCPNLGVSPEFKEPVAIRAADRRRGMPAIAYLVESIYDPDAFVVPGYSRGLMKPIHKPPIALSHVEIAAVVAYLWSHGGQEVTPEVVSQIQRQQQPFRTAVTRVSGEEAGAALRIPEGDPQTGFKVFKEMECYECHRIKNFKFPGSEESTGKGPDLTGIGEIQTREYLFESVLNPNAVVVRGPGYTGEDGKSKMPEFHDVMTVRQLQDLAAFLSSLKADSAAAQFAGGEDQKGKEE